jgi:N-acetylglucosaminyldiphosphoundecaprenol N-acetyl-beta-D-mannosaminyltransferase
MELTTCNILGTEIAVTNMKETVALIEENIEELRGQYICVGNVHTTVMAHDDAHYHKVQHDAAFVLPDGKPLSVYCQKKGFADAKRVTGPDLMLELFARENGLRHYFYGGSEETLALLRENLTAKYPNLVIAGMVSPPFRELTPEEEQEAVRAINDSNADIIWVGLGAPKQENWMYAHKDKVQGVMIGVGAGFDYHAGNIKRAPMWMQKLSLEWLYRLLQDPKRLFKRYLVTNTRYLWLIHCRKH